MQENAQGELTDVVEDRLLINPFFLRPEGEPKRPPRLYAFVTDRLANGHVLFDAVDANWFDENAEGVTSPEQWRGMAPKAPVYFLEAFAEDSPWVRDFNLFSRLSRLRWVEIFIGSGKPRGLLYANINGPGIRVSFGYSPMALQVRQAIQAATDLTPYIASNASIESLLPSASPRQVIALDVGQASSNAIVDASGDVVAYVDLGAPGLGDTATWPSAMKAVCLAKDPLIVLSHWHYDHFQLANIQPAALSLNWIAPFQILGMGAQSAMAASIAPGKLKVWNRPGRIGTTAGIELERCLGPSGNLNRTGIAVWVKGPPQTDPILLPGDGGYKDIPSLPTRTITGFAAAHHGGHSPGTPPSPPRHGLNGLAMSYGHGNSYGHPLAGPVKALAKAGWTLGPFPGRRVDERRTEDHPGGTGGTGLGHIELRWPGSAPAQRSCTCGCTITPTQ